MIWKLLFSNIPFVGPMHFLFAVCENYALLHVISIWTKLSIPIPCGVISFTDLTMVTSSLQNYQKMFEIEFSTKRISRIYNVSKIKKTAATGYLYTIRPSYYFSEAQSDCMNSGKLFKFVLDHYQSRTWNSAWLKQLNNDDLMICA